MAPAARQRKCRFGLLLQGRRHQQATGVVEAGQRILCEPHGVTKRKFDVANLKAAPPRSL
jgi:hypothetical protein